MRTNLTFGLALAVVFAPACIGQQWEIGGLGGYGWYSNPTITNAVGSATASFAPKFAMGAVFGNNMYKYIGGEVRWMMMFGRPALSFNGVEESTTGYTNTIHYDLLIHTAPQEAKVRPFFAAGAGINVYSATGRRELDQPLLTFAVLRPVNQVEPLISVGGGVKYLVAKGIQLRLDFRTYMTPTENVYQRATQ